MKCSRLWPVFVAGFLLAVLAPPALSARDEPTVDELKARLPGTQIRDLPPLCIRISELQIAAADKFFADGDAEKANRALVDVVAFAELARDYAIQSHKHEKQAEIALRKMTRKLTDLKHAVTHDDQEHVQNTIDRLQKVRDDLLAAMFPKKDSK
jgi:hypothetical protein